MDDLLTFQDLGVHLKSNRCHVASLSGLDFLAKHGIGGCVRSLLRQLVSDASDVSYRDFQRSNFISHEKSLLILTSYGLFAYFVLPGG